MTYWEHSQSVRRFQRILQALGIEAALRKAGVQNGDTVFIGELRAGMERLDRLGVFSAGPLTRPTWVT